MSKNLHHVNVANDLLPTELTEKNNSEMVVVPYKIILLCPQN